MLCNNLVIIRNFNISQSMGDSTLMYQNYISQKDIHMSLLLNLKFDFLYKQCNLNQFTHMFNIDKSTICIRKILFQSSLKDISSQYLLECDYHNILYIKLFLMNIQGIVVRIGCKIFPHLHNSEQDIYTKGIVHDFQGILHHLCIRCLINKY